MSDSFYTSVEVRGDNILTTGYENGLPFNRKVPFSPSLYYPDPKGEFWSQDGKTKLGQKKYSTISEMKDSVKTYSGISGHKIFGTQNLVSQYITETYPDEIKWDTSLIQIWFFDIETKVSAGFPDPLTALEEIQLITMYNYTKGKGTVFSTIPCKEDNPIFAEGADFQYYETEDELLARFVAFFRENRIDILSGWNSDLFDVPYLIHRIQNVLGEATANLLSPWKSLKKRTMNVLGKDRLTYDISGICHLDYLELYKKFNPGSQESFKLDHIAELELGRKKVENPGESFRDFYESYPETFVHYNWVDVTLLRDMEDKLQSISLALLIAYMSKTNIDDVFSSMRVWEAVIFNHFAKMGRFAHSNAPRRSARSIPGAYVHPPKQGKYRWAVSIDATALYPSIMMQNNISPDTKVMKLDGVTPESILAGIFPEFDRELYSLSANGVLCRKDFEGYIAYLVRQKFDQRKEFKKEMLILDTEAQKIRDELNHDDIPSDRRKSLQDRLDYLEPMVRMLDLKQKAVKVE